MTTQTPPVLTGLKFVIRFTDEQIYIGVDKVDHDPHLFTYGIEDWQAAESFSNLLVQSAEAAEGRWAEAAKFPKYTPPAKPKTQAKKTAKSTTGRGRTRETAATPETPANNPRLF